MSTRNLLNLRYKRYKIVFAEQRAHGFDVWANPFTFLRFPKLFDLRSDPFAHADEIDLLPVLPVSLLRSRVAGHVGR